MSHAMHLTDYGTGSLRDKYQFSERPYGGPLPNSLYGIDHTNLIRTKILNHAEDRKFCLSNFPRPKILLEC